MESHRNEGLEGHTAHQKDLTLLLSFVQLQHLRVVINLPRVLHPQRICYAYQWTPDAVTDKCVKHQLDTFNDTTPAEGSKLVQLGPCAVGEFRKGLRLSEFGWILVLMVGEGYCLGRVVQQQYTCGSLLLGFGVGAPCIQERGSCPTWKSCILCTC